MDFDMDEVNPSQKLQLEIAVDQLKQASKDEEKKNLTQALHLYKDGLSTLMQVIKGTKNDRIKQILKQKFATYLKRAETIKSELEDKTVSSHDRSCDASEISQEGPEEYESVTCFHSTPYQVASFSELSLPKPCKNILMERIVLPLLYPHLFNSLGSRSWKSEILLFGPPGVGKTYCVKSLAIRCGACLLHVHLCDILSPHCGDAEIRIKKLVKYAKTQQPCIILLDDFDYLEFTQEGEGDATRRIYTELMMQITGIKQEYQVFVILGTSAPWKIPRGTRRRCIKCYLPLPSYAARKAMLAHTISGKNFKLTTSEIDRLACDSVGFSMADIQVAISDALMEPVREFKEATHFKKIAVGGNCDFKFFPCSADDPDAMKINIMELSPDEIYVAPVTVDVLSRSILKLSPSVSQEEISKHEEYVKLWFEDYPLPLPVDNPASLQTHCKELIRLHTGSCETNLRQLPLPNKMIEYLCKEEPYMCAN